jgi:hypothetical protein
MIVFFIFSVFFAEMSNNFGASYYAASRGARSNLIGNEAVILNPSNIVLEEQNLSFNSFCYDKYCSLGTAYSVQEGFGLFFSMDDIDRDISFESLNFFASFAFFISDRFSIGSSFGYFSSNLYNSGFKYSAAFTFSPFSLNKKNETWLISSGYLKDFLAQDEDEFFISYTYKDYFFAVSLDYLFSNNHDTYNYQVLATSLNLTDYLKLLSSIKFFDFSTDDISYGAGFKIFYDTSAILFSFLKENMQTYYAFSIQFIGD